MCPLCVDNSRLQLFAEHWAGRASKAGSEAIRIPAPASAPTTCLPATRKAKRKGRGSNLISRAPDRSTVWACVATVMADAASADRSKVRMEVM